MEEPTAVESCGKGDVVVVNDAAGDDEGLDDVAIGYRLKTILPFADTRFPLVTPAVLAGIAEFRQWRAWVHLVLSVGDTSSIVDVCCPTAALIRQMNLGGHGRIKRVIRNKLPECVRTPNYMEIADVLMNQVKVDGEPLLTAAMKSNRMDLVRMLWQQASDSETFWDPVEAVSSGMVAAARNGFMEPLVFAVEHEVPFSHRVLCGAVKSGSLDLCKFCLKHLNAEDVSEMLHGKDVAPVSWEIAQWLLDHGCSPGSIIQGLSTVLRDSHRRVNERESTGRSVDEWDTSTLSQQRQEVFQRHGLALEDDVAALGAGGSDVGKDEATPADAADASAPADASSSAAADSGKGKADARDAGGDADDEAVAEPEAEPEADGAAKAADAAEADGAGAGAAGAGGNAGGAGPNVATVTAPRVADACEWMDFLRQHSEPGAADTCVQTSWSLDDYRQAYEREDWDTLSWWPHSHIVWAEQWKKAQASGDTQRQTALLALIDGQTQAIVDTQASADEAAVFPYLSHAGTIMRATSASGEQDARDTAVATDAPDFAACVPHNPYAPYATVVIPPASEDMELRTMNYYSQNYEDAVWILESTSITSIESRFMEEIKRTTSFVACLNHGALANAREKDPNQVPESGGVWVSARLLRTTRASGYALLHAPSRFKVFITRPIFEAGIDEDEAARRLCFATVHALHERNQDSIILTDLGLQHNGWTPEAVVRVLRRVLTDPGAMILGAEFILAFPPDCALHREVLHRLDEWDLDDDLMERVRYHDADTIMDIMGKLIDHPDLNLNRAVSDLAGAPCMLPYVDRVLERGADPIECVNGALTANNVQLAVRLAEQVLAKEESNTDRLLLIENLCSILLRQDEYDVMRTWLEKRPQDAWYALDAIGSSDKDESLLLWMLDHELVSADEVLYSGSINSLDNHAKVLSIVVPKATVDPNIVLLQNYLSTSFLRSCLQLGLSKEIILLRATEDEDDTRLMTELSNDPSIRADRVRWWLFREPRGDAQGYFTTGISPIKCPLLWPQTLQCIRWTDNVNDVLSMVEMDSYIDCESLALVSCRGHNVEPMRHILKLGVPWRYYQRWIGSLYDWEEAAWQCLLENDAPADLLMELSTRKLHDVSKMQLAMARCDPLRRTELATRAIEWLASTGSPPIEKLKYLLEQGGDPEAGSLLVNSSDVTTVRLLIDAGANVTRMASKCDSTAPLSFLIAKGAHLEALMRVPCQTGNVVLMRSLLDKGANPTAGIARLRAEHFQQCAPMLLEAGADPTAALTRAVIRSPSMVSDLLQRGASATRAFDDASSVCIRKLHELGYLDILLDHGADPTSALTGYVLSKSPKEVVIDTLLARGADPSDRYFRYTVSMCGASNLSLYLRKYPDFVDATDVLCEAVRETKLGLAMDALAAGADPVVGLSALRGYMEWGTSRYYEQRGIVQLLLQATDDPLAARGVRASVSYAGLTPILLERGLDPVTVLEASLRDCTTGDMFMDFLTSIEDRFDVTQHPHLMAVAEAVGSYTVVHHLRQCGMETTWWHVLESKEEREAVLSKCVVRLECGTAWHGAGHLRVLDGHMCDQEVTIVVGSRLVAVDVPASEVLCRIPARLSRLHSYLVLRRLPQRTRYWHLCDLVGRLRTDTMLSFLDRHGEAMYEEMMQAPKRGGDSRWAPLVHSKVEEIVMYGTSVDDMKFLACEGTPLFRVNTTNVCSRLYYGTIHDGEADDMASYATQFLLPQHPHIKLSNLVEAPFEDVFVKLWKKRRLINMDEEKALCCLIRGEWAPYCHHLYPKEMRAVVRTLLLSMYRSGVRIPLPVLSMIISYVAFHYDAMTWRKRRFTVVR